MFEMKNAAQGRKPTPKTSTYKEIAMKNALNNVINFPKLANSIHSDSEEREPFELKDMDAQQLVNYRKYLRWRLDCLHVLNIADFKWFQHYDYHAYHKSSMQNEFAFVEQTISAIDEKLNKLGI